MNTNLTLEVRLVKGDDLEYTYKKQNETYVTRLLHDNFRMFKYESGFPIYMYVWLLVNAYSSIYCVMYVLVEQSSANSKR